MSLNTKSINQSRQNLQTYDEIWLFGYGSLIYKVDFPIIAKSEAYIVGWERRFWQGSHDHRGTPDNPGRVLTLTPSNNQQCHGIAYQVSAETFDHLDHREKNGYLRYQVDIHLADQSVKKGLVYIAPQDNAAFLGEAPEKDIAEHIFKSSGPSGKNADYVLLLADALRNLTIEDPHIFEIERYLIALEKHSKTTQSKDSLS